MGLRRLIATAFALIACSGAAAAPAMWEVSDSDSRVRLLGSIHALPDNADWRTEPLDSAIEAAPFVYFETDIGPRGMLAMTLKLIGASFAASQDEPWLGRLTLAQTEQLAEIVARYGMSLEDAGRMPPWLLAAQISMPNTDHPDLSGFDFANGVESVLQWELVPERKGYFETPGEQFDMLAAGTIEEQIDFLLMTIDQTGGDDEMLASLVEAWLSGDVDAIALLTVASLPDEQAVLDRLLIQRNRNWVPTIERMLADNEDNLIVVGAAHLAGEDDVLDLLAAAGYTVERIQ